MYCLKNWFLRNHGGYVVAWGDVYDNPNFLDGTNIHTSEIKKVLIEEERVVFTTYSQSNYAVNFDEIRMDARDVCEDAFGQLSLDVAFLDKCLELTAAKQKKKLSEVSQILLPNELYFEVSGDSILNAYFKDNEKNMIIPDISTHVGTIQDSVLIQAYEKVDFRLFPNWNSLRVYHWSENLKKVIIKCIGADVCVSGANKEFVCHKDETIELLPEDFQTEGLVSTDCVNGKSMLTDG